MHHPTSPLKVIRSYSHKTPLDSSTFYRCLLHHFRIFYESFGQDNQTQKGLNLLPTSPFTDRKSNYIIPLLGGLIIISTTKIWRVRRVFLCESKKTRILCVIRGSTQRFS